MRPVAAGAVSLALVLTLAAPGTATTASETTAVKHTLVAYIHALDDENGKAACRLLTPRAKEAVEEEGPCAPTLASLGGASGLFPHVRIGTIRVNGSRATVDIRISGGAARIPLRRIAGHWLLDAPAPELL